MTKDKEEGPGEVNTRAALEHEQGQNAEFRSGLEPLFEAGHEFIALHHFETQDRKGRNIGKAPSQARWRKLRALSLDAAVAHLAEGCNVGVRLREEDLVVDVDPRNFEDGDDPLTRLEADLGVPLRELCPTVRTGGGGLHLYLRKPADVSVRDTVDAYKGIEFKAFGRQVVAPGSIHPETRRRYALVAFRDAPEAPQELLGIIGKAQTAVPAEAGVIEPEELAVLLEALDPTAYPTDAAWRPLMMACHHATAGAGREEFVAWSTSDSAFADDGWEIGRRWDSLKLDNRRPITVRALLDEVRKVAKGPAAELCRVVYAQLDFSEPVEPEALEALLRSPAPRSAWRLDRVEPTRARSRFLSLDEIMDMPDPEWLVKGIIPKGGVGLLVGQSQTYKSFLALHLALSLSTGTAPHPDHPAAGTYETVIVAGEGGGGFKLRARAWMNAHPELRPSLLLQPSPSYLDQEDAVASIIEALGQLEPRHRLLVIDTFSANFTGKENTDDAAAFVRSCQRIALEADVTVLVIHHLGKDSDKGARGHSSLTANTDFWLTLDRPDKGKRVVRLRQGKLKDAAFEQDLWFEAVSVPVEGCGDFKDSLVLRPTSKPRVNETTMGEDEVDEQIRTILGHVKDGDPVTPVQQAIQDLGLSRPKAVQRMGEALEAMPQLSVEKLGGAEGNRRVFRVRQ